MDDFDIIVLCLQLYDIYISSCTKSSREPIKDKVPSIAHRYESCSKWNALNCIVVN